MTAGLIAGLALGASAVPEASASPVARHGDLTNRPAGMPATANPAQKLRSASVRQNLARSSVSGRFTLQASPPASESHHGQHGTLSVNFGNSDSGTCFPDVNHGRFEVALAGDLAGSGFTRSGATYTLSTSSAAAGWSNWDCAYVAVLDSSSTVVDGLVGDLAETHGRPSVAVRSVRLLGSVRQPFPLVRGVWTMLEVELANTGASDARRVVITGNGRGAMVRRTPVGTVSTSTGSTVMVPVRFTGRASRAVVRLRVAGAGTAASRLVRLKRTRFRKPLPGRYRDRAGNVNFRVRNGQIVQFRGKIRPGRIGATETALP